MRSLGAPLTLLFAGGCSSAAVPGFQTGDGGGDGGAKGDAVATSTDGGREASIVLHGGDGAMGPSGNAVVYGHSADTLYAVNPNTNAVTSVGDFSGCDGDVVDIALDKASTMYATTFTSVYTIDVTTAACHHIASSDTTMYPNSLSFVPAGTLDPSVEALVGYNGSTYVRIDTTNGNMTNVGSLGGSAYMSSGDIVSVIGGGTYLTVTGGSECSEFDCLVEVNPKTGAIIKNYGSVSHQEVYGLAFWAGTVFGFDAEGNLFEVTFPASGAIGIKDIAIPGEMLGLSFNGAGSTTSAPPVPIAK